MPQLPDPLKPWTQWVAFAIALLTLWGFIIAPIEKRITAVEKASVDDVTTLKVHVDEVLESKLTSQAEKNQAAADQLSKMDTKLDKMLEGLSRLDERTLWLQRQHANE